MFTGIVEGVGTVRTAGRRGDVLVVRVDVGGLFEGLGGKDGLLSLLPDVLVERGHDFKVEVVFGVEMVVEHRFVDPGGFGDSVDPGAVDTVAGELVYRGGDNFLPGSSGSGFGGHFALDI